MTLPEKTQLFSRTIEHIDITRMDVVPIVESMGQMAFSARDLSRAAACPVPGTLYLIFRS